MIKACKKTIIISICLTMIFVIVGIGALTVSADNPTSGTCGDNLTWEYNSASQTLTISGTGEMWSYEYASWTYSHTAPWHSYSSTIKTVVIESGVKSIGDYAFDMCSALTSITIPDGVTSIGKDAFWGCSSLTSVIIPDSVLNIGKGAFHNSGLTSITIPDSVTNIGSGAFSETGYYNDSSNWQDDVLYIGKHFIEAKDTISGSYAIKDGTLCIGGHAFADHTGLTSITIPDSVTGIGDNAFLNCKNLTSIIIPNSVLIISDNAFAACTGLTSISIGKHVTSIGDSAFSNCKGLTSITIPDSVTSIGDSAFYKCTGLTSITIGNSVTSIGDYAFFNCIGLTSITIPDSVTNIGSSAFCKCTGLTSITIGNSVAYIGSSAFSECTGLTSIAIPDSVTSIETNAFDNCPLEYVKMGSGLTDIPSTLIHKDSLKTFIIGPNVTNVGGFSGCSGLTSITIPDKVVSINSSAFESCIGLTSITIGNTVASIGKNAFYGCKEITSITIPNSVTSIGYYAFDNCPLEYVKMGDGLTSIPSTLIHKDNLKTFIIGKSVASIGNYTFSDCTGLTSITIPNSVTSIGYEAFRGCSGLKSITISDSVTSIGGSAFYGCPLEYVKMGSGLTEIPSTLINKDSLKTFIIGENVSHIQHDAFKDCSNLTEITIPNSVTSIGENAFKGCTGLTSITIPNSVTSIGNSSFYGCTNLATITLPDTVTKIGKYAFVDTAYYKNDSNWQNDILYIGIYLIKCKDKNDLVGNKSVKSGTICIADEAFSYCGNIINLSVPDTVKYIGTNAFYDVTNVAYTGTATGSPWGARSRNGFVDGNLVYKDPNKIKLIACASNASGHIEIPASVDTIENNTFKNCFKVESIYIPLNTTRVGVNAFDGSGIKEVYYEGSVVDKTGISIADGNTKLTDATWHYNTPSSGVTPSNPDVSKAKISAPTGTKTINWKYKAHLVASATNLPGNCHVAWYEGKTKISDEADFTTDNLTANHTYTAKIVDSSGKVVSSSAQEKTVKVEVKTDFFSKLISFFMRLFGSDVVDV